jgi:hypothetical protein
MRPILMSHKKIAKINEPTQKKSIWDRAVHIFSILSEAANIGIVIEIIAKWWPALLTLGQGFLSLIPFYSDPIIYFFKSLIRLTKLVGRTLFGITFADEKNGGHPWQTLGDILSLSFFSLSVPMFLGAVVSGPVGITIGWSLALCGLCVVGFFDYRYQAKVAQMKYKQADEKESDLLFKEYRSKRNSYILYMGLLLGLGCLLICGSAALFAPPALAPILVIISKAASCYLGLIAAGRFYNWVVSHKKPGSVSDNTVSACSSIPDSPITLSQLNLAPTVEPTASEAPVHLPPLFVSPPEHRSESASTTKLEGAPSENSFAQGIYKRYLI